MDLFIIIYVIPVNKSKILKMMSGWHFTLNTWMMLLYTIENHFQNSIKKQYFQVK